MHASMVKVVVVGDSFVGKTSIIHQFVERRFTADFKTTIGSDFASKPVAVDDSIVNLQIWDTAGQERYRSLSTTYFKGCEAAVIVFDVTNEESFAHVTFWAEEVQKSCQPVGLGDIAGGGDAGPRSRAALPIFVVGNKSDMEAARVVSKKRAFEVCKGKGWVYNECSAKYGDNIDTLFKACAVAVVDRRSVLPQVATRPGSIGRAQFAATANRATPVSRDERTATERLRPSCCSK
jgi:Ras-related protein Rab-7A